MNQQFFSDMANTVQSTVTTIIQIQTQQLKIYIDNQIDGLRAELKDDMMSQQEVLEIFRISRKTLKRWRDDMGLPFHKDPGSNRVYYYRSEIKQWQSDRDRLLGGGSFK